MKKIIGNLLLASTMISSVYAYDASKIEVGFTGYKMKIKVPVPGTFTKTTLDIKKNADFEKFLTSANVTIDVDSIDTKMKMRNNNIKSTLFKVANIKEINAKVVKVMGDDMQGTVDIEIDMNNTKKIIPMMYITKDDVLTAKGAIDILDFAMNESFAAFAKKCKPFHAGMTWTNVDISFNLTYTK